MAINERQDSHETKVDKRIHSLVGNKPPEPVAGQLGSIASHKMSASNQEIDYEEVDKINRHNSPSRSLQQEEALLKKFISETLEELVRDEDEVIDEFSSAGGGGSPGAHGGGAWGEWQPPKNNSKSKLGDKNKK